MYAARTAPQTRSFAIRCHALASDVAAWYREVPGSKIIVITGRPILLNNERLLAQRLAFMPERLVQVRVTDADVRGSIGETR